MNDPTAVSDVLCDCAKVLDRVGLPQCAAWVCTHTSAELRLLTGESMSVVPLGVERIRQDGQDVLLLDLELSDGERWGIPFSQIAWTEPDRDLNSPAAVLKQIAELIENQRVSPVGEELYFRAVVGSHEFIEVTIVRERKRCQP